MNLRSSSERPPIDMIDTEAHRLADLAVRVEERAPELCAMLLAEVERASLHDAARIPQDVVTMNATVEFTDEASGTTRTVQLVYPADADIAAGRISILTPVGAGLIGMHKGQSIVWPDRDGHERRLRVVRVEQAQRAA